MCCPISSWNRNIKRASLNQPQGGKGQEHHVSDVGTTWHYPLFSEISFYPFGVTDACSVQSHSVHIINMIIANHSFPSPSSTTTFNRFGFSFLACAHLYISIFLNNMCIINLLIGSLLIHRYLTSINFLIRYLRAWFFYATMPLASLLPYPSWVIFQPLCNCRFHVYIMVPL